MKTNAPGVAGQADASPSNLVAIDELASSCGVSHRTLRYYEELGLLTSHRQHGTRCYDSGQKARLENLLKGRRLGFTLREMTALLKNNRDQTQEILMLTEQTTRVELVDPDRHRQDLAKTIDEICGALNDPIDRRAVESAPVCPQGDDDTVMAPPRPIVAKNAQLREARRLLNWTIRDLARCAGVRMKMITQAETEDNAQGHARQQIVRTLQAAGVEFTSEGPLGVRFNSEALRQRNAELSRKVEAGAKLVGSSCRMEIRLVASEVAPAFDARQLFRNLQQQRRVLETAGVEFIRTPEGETVARMRRMRRSRRAQK